MSTKKLNKNVTSKHSLTSKFPPTISIGKKSSLKRQKQDKTDTAKVTAVLEYELIKTDFSERREYYRSLFDSIDEGFCIIEVLFKKTGKAYDHRILEANAAFTKHTGVKNPVGKMASDLVFGGEQFFNNIYRQVVTTGKPQRFEQKSEAMKRWFNIFVSRVGLASKNTVAVIFTDITKAKLDEDTINQSEMRFRGFVTASSDAIYRMSSDWMEMRELYGKNYIVDTKKPTTAWLKKYIDKNDEERVLVEIKKAIKSKSIFEMEHRFKYMNGELGWVLSRAVPIIDDDGNIKEWFGTLKNVTESRNTKDKLQVSEKRYRRLFESAKDGILILDVNSRKITDANPFVTELISYSKEELIGKELWEIGFFKDKKENKAAMLKLQKVGYIRYEDLPLKTKKGKQIDVEFVSNKYKENEDFVIQCNIRDITLRKKELQELTEAKAEAQTTKDNLKRLFSAAPAIIAVLRGPELIFEMANLQYRQLIAGNRELVGLPLQVAIPDLEPSLLKIIKDAAEKGIRFEASEFPVLLDWRNTGSPYTKFFNFVYEPLYDSKKKPNGIMVFGDDITEQVQNRKKLEEAARIKDEFLSMASHEMRTPVTSIKGYAQILESQFKNEGNQTSFRMISKLIEQVDNLNSLIKDLFDDTKVKEGKLDLRPNYFDFNLLVSEVIEDMQHTTKQHKIKSKLADIPQIYADKLRLRQVIVNLLTNAIKYSPDETLIKVETTRNEESVSLSIQDYGFGISKEMQSKIFTRFYRAQDEVMDTYPGLGLGLYIAADIIERHGGSIKVKSQKGKGSVFTTTVPIKNKSI